MGLLFFTILITSVRTYPRLSQISKLVWQQAQVNQNGTQAGAQPPSTMAAARPVAAASTPAPVQAPALTAKTSGFDLLGDLSNDPFASSAPQSSSSSAGQHHIS